MPQTNSGTRVDYGDCSDFGRAAHLLEVLDLAERALVEIKHAQKLQPGHNVTSVSHQTAVTLNAIDDLLGEVVSELRSAGCAVTRSND